MSGIGMGKRSPIALKAKCQRAREFTLSTAYNLVANGFLESGLSSTVDGAKIPNYWTSLSLGASDTSLLNTTGTYIQKGKHSWKLACGDGDGLRSAIFKVVSGEDYKVDIDIYIHTLPGSGGSVTWADKNNVLNFSGSNNRTGWSNYSATITASSSGSEQIDIKAASGVCTFFIDSVRVYPA